MTTKQYLGQILHIDQKIQDKIAEVEMWKQIAMGSRMGGDDSGDRVQTSKHYDKMGDAVAKYVDYADECCETARQLGELKYRISKQIDFMPNELHYRILKNYYILGKTATECMTIVGYEKSQYYKHFTASIDDFESLYGEQYLHLKANA